MATIDIGTDKAFYYLTPFALSLIPYKDGRILICADQYVRVFMSKSREYRESIINAVSVKQILFLSKPATMQNNGFEIDAKFENIRLKLTTKVFEMKIRYNPLVGDLLRSTKKSKIIYTNKYDKFFTEHIGQILMNIRSGKSSDEE